MGKKIHHTLLAVGLLAILGKPIGDIYLDYKDYYSFSFLPVKTTQKLKVNQNETYREICSKSEEEGIKDLERLCDASPFEEAFFYLPEKREWVECGKNAEIYESSEGTVTSVCYDPYLKDKLMRENRSLISYHFHPSKVTLKKYVGDINSDLEQKLRVIERNSSFFVANDFVSKPDVVNMISDTLEHSELHEDGDFTCKVVCSHGVIEYALTKKGIVQAKAFKEEFMKDILEKMDKEQFNKRYDLWNQPPKESLEYFCSSLSDDHIQFRFTPHK